MLNNLHLRLGAKSSDIGGENCNLLLTVAPLGSRILHGNNVNIYNYTIYIIIRIIPLCSFLSVVKTGLPQSTTVVDSE